MVYFLAIVARPFFGELTMSDPNDDRIDGMTLAELEQEIHRFTAQVADSRELDEQIQSLKEAFARDDERERQRRMPRMQKDAPPANAVELLAAREAELTKLVNDPTSDMKDVRRARQLVDRARPHAEAEQRDATIPGQMMRSIVARAEERAPIEAAERARQREREKADQAAKDESQRYARRVKYVSG